MEDKNSDIISRIKYLIQLKRISQAEFARRINIDPSNLCKHLTSKLPITDVLINRIVVEMGVSKQWLKYGDDVPYSKVAGQSVEVLDVEKLSVVKQPGIPVYDIDVTAGCEELSMMFTQDKIDGFVSLPRMSQNSIIVRVSGNSMYPEINDGGYIAIRPVKNIDTIFWGHIYVVVTEDYRLVKYVRRDNADDKKIILHSANPEYDDMELPKSSIKNLFLVEAILNFKICG
ncbi:MAG: XRE family transcriptional regulator [Bacteroidales bacterium]|nr:XRE family transcriptional regulator [Bacteroidales bacterium]